MFSYHLAFRCRKKHLFWQTIASLSLVPQGPNHLQNIIASFKRCPYNSKWQRVLTIANYEFGTRGRLSKAKLEVMGGLAFATSHKNSTCKHFFYLTGVCKEPIHERKI